MNPPSENQLTLAERLWHGALGLGLLLLLVLFLFFSLSVEADFVTYCHAAATHPGTTSLMFVLIGLSAFSMLGQPRAAWLVAMVFALVGLYITWIALRDPYFSQEMEFICQVIGFFFIFVPAFLLFSCAIAG